MNIVKKILAGDELRPRSFIPKGEALSAGRLCRGGSSCQI